MGFKKLLMRCDLNFKLSTLHITISFWEWPCQPYKSWFLFCLLFSALALHNGSKNAKCCQSSVSIGLCRTICGEDHPWPYSCWCQGVWREHGHSRCRQNIATSCNQSCVVVDLLCPVCAESGLWDPWQATWLRLLQKRHTMSHMVQKLVQIELGGPHIWSSTLWRAAE